MNAQHTHKTDLSASDIVIFGGTGDLSQRKILPALYHRLREGQLPAASRIVVLGRAERTPAEHAAFMDKIAATFIAANELHTKDWELLCSRVHYHSLRADNAEDYARLRTWLDNDANEVRIFYLSTPATIYGDICAHIHGSGLQTPQSRIVLEKPIGYGLESFSAINSQVLRFFDEKQIYRIDHYLGKETVQNLMVLRFTNNVFQRIWNGDMVDHVQITVAESTSLENRHSYYDDAGAMRDMVQNHLLQLLCLVAMEPPNKITADAIRDEKLKVLRALRPMDATTVKTETVRGQYGAGTIGTRTLDAYLTEIGKPHSITETYVAIKAQVDNWRWANVPFYMRTGKAMKGRYSEIVIQFKEVPHTVFPDQEAGMANRLVIRLQPDEYIQFQMFTKIPGPGGYRFKPVKLNLSLTEEFEERYPEAYERLLMDVVRGNQTLFMRSDEVEAAWLWVETILRGWQEAGQVPEIYPAGSEPEAALALLAKDGRAWN
jgi:glucose-6-phosphate 1-dehydrogenase